MGTFAIHTTIGDAYTDNFRTCSLQNMMVTLHKKQQEDEELLRFLTAQPEKVGKKKVILCNCFIRTVLRVSKLILHAFDAWNLHLVSFFQDFTMLRSQQLTQTQPITMKSAQSSNFTNYCSFLFVSLIIIVLGANLRHLIVVLFIVVKMQTLVTQMSHVCKKKKKLLKTVQSNQQMFCMKVGVSCLCCGTQTKAINRQTLFLHKIHWEMAEMGQ